MRLRNIPGLEETIHKDYPAVMIHAAASYQGKWRAAAFGNSQPLQLELGSGMGGFVLAKAQQEPLVNFIGLEKREEALVKTCKRSVGLGLHNLRLLLEDVGDLAKIFAPSEIERIYLNFSDPWPKNKHEKRRLTHKGFLALYAQVLVEQGEVHLKTDNQQLFEYSLNSFEAAGWQLANISWDYPAQAAYLDVPTEYESKFRNKGQKIFRLEAKKPS
ncbi:MAG: tRNA (guanosine(46)-N7)-methyltransferase TrmB [Clostridia bacterium]